MKGRRPSHPIRCNSLFAALSVAIDLPSIASYHSLTDGHAVTTRRPDHFALPRFFIEKTKPPNPGRELTAFKERETTKFKAHFFKRQRIVRPLLLFKVGCKDFRSIREHQQNFTPVRGYYYVAQCALGAAGRQCIGLRERAPAVGANRVGAGEGSAAAKPGHIVDVTTGQISAPVKGDDPQ